MKKSFAILLLTFIFILNINAAINSVLNENHFSYTIIKDFMSRKLLIAPELYSEGSIITRKDMALMSVMLLTNTDDELYMKEISYYDAKNILKLVIEFSDEINFYFAGESEQVEKRIQKLEKKVEMPAESTFTPQTKKIDIPEVITRKIDKFATTFKYKVSPETYNSDNDTEFLKFYPDRSEDLLIKTRIEMESKNLNNPDNVVNFTIDSWYKDHNSDINGILTLKDTDYSLIYSDLEQDKFFKLDSSGLSEDFVYVNTNDFGFLRRMNGRNDITENIFMKRFGEYNLSYMKREAEVDGILAKKSTFNQKKIIINTKYRDLYAELGIADSDIEGVSSSEDSIAYYMNYDKDMITSRIDVEIASIDKYYDIKDNIFNYKSIGVPSQGKDIFKLNYFRIFNDSLTGAVMWSNDETENKDYYRENTNIMFNYRRQNSMYLFNYSKSEEFDVFEKNFVEEDTMLNFNIIRNIGRFNAVFNIVKADNETAYKGIERAVFSNRLNLNTRLTPGKEASIYFEDQSYENTNIAHNRKDDEDITRVGFELLDFKKTGQIIKARTDYVDCSGIKNYVEGKFYIGMEMGSGRNAMYEVGAEYIDHSGKKGDQSFENNNILLNYIRNF